MHVAPAPLVLARPERGKIIDSLAGKFAVKLSVKREGFYRVSGADLFAAGLDPKAKPEKIQLYVDGLQVPIKVDSDNDGRVTGVEFYGGNGERENFFGAVNAGEPVDQTLLLGNIDMAATGQATIEVALQGVTILQHRVSVQVNGTFAGEVQFEGQSNEHARMSIAQSLLSEGVNTVRLTAQGGTSDVSLVDYIQITYGHKFAADDDVLRFTAGGGQSLTVSGFSGAVRVFDVTDASGVEEIAATVEPHNGVYSATFASPRVGERKFLALANNRADRPAGITANQASDLHSKNHAGAFVIVTREEE
jgi:hypothetical protein